jgi:hypothetical protein
MTDVYLAVGHGINSSGVYDPGAIGTGGRQEHLEAYEICQWATAALRRSGVSVISETAAGASHDPDFIGSANRANAIGAKVAVEVHLDFSKGVKGFSGLFVSDKGKQLASMIGDEFAARDLARARDVARHDLFFLNATRMTALIPEVNVVMDYSRTVNRTQGEGLAAGICKFLGKPFVAGETVPAPVDTGRRWDATRDDGKSVGPFDRLLPLLDALGPLVGPDRDLAITLRKKIV